jgi:methane monooxygenase PmoA-like
MRSILCVLIVFGGAAPVVGAQDLDGKQIVLEAGDQISRNAPISVAYDGADVAGGIAVTEATTGMSYPATARAGEFVFVPEGAMPGTTHTYAVAVGEAGEPRVKVEKKGGASEVDVVIDGKPFVVYHYSNDNKKPFLWPVYSEGEVTVTRHWPMGPTEGHDDHPHHKSIWTSFGNVNGVDCWGEGQNSGIQHSDDVTFGSGDAYGWIRAKNTWQSKDGEPVVMEEREYRFYAAPADARIFDTTVTFTASHGDVVFGDTKEGGIMAIRVRPEIEASRGGTISNALGNTGEKECWGQPSPWCDYSGMIEGAGVRGITVMDHPSNLRHPSRWHVRDYGLMGANVFGLSYFTRDRANPTKGNHTLTAGESLTFRYRVLVHSGDVAEAQVSERYADYAKPPKAAWK